MSSVKSSIHARLTIGTLIDQINGLIAPGRTSLEMRFEYRSSTFRDVIGLTCTQ